VATVLNLAIRVALFVGALVPLLRWLFRALGERPHTRGDQEVARTANRSGMRALPEWQGGAPIHERRGPRPGR
jgi:hypothetical protein